MIETALEAVEETRKWMETAWGIIDAPLEPIITAIQALEQEDILGKVRAEIESEIISHSGTGEEVIQAYVDGLLKAVEIIDKYREGGASE